MGHEFKGNINLLNTNNIINWSKLTQNLKFRVKIESIKNVRTKMIQKIKCKIIYPNYFIYS